MNIKIQITNNIKLLTLLLLRRRLMPPPPPPLRFPRCTRMTQYIIRRTWLIIARAPIIKI